MTPTLIAPLHFVHSGVTAGGIAEVSYQKALLSGIKYIYRT